MISFWLSAAAMVAAALALLLPSFFRRPNGAVGPGAEQYTVALAREQLQLLQARREQGELSPTEFEQGRAELVTRLSADLDVGSQKPAEASAGRGMWAGALIGFLVPALAGGLYLSLGAPVVLGPDAAAQETAADQHATGEEMVSALAARLAQQPDDVQGWYMLGRSLMVLGRYDEAAQALERVVALGGGNADVLVGYADALAMADGGRIAGKPAELIARALALQPQHPYGLWLAGMAAAQGGEDAKAVDFWQRVLPLVSDDARSTAELRHLISEAQQRLGEGVAPLAVASGAASLNVRVSLDPALAQRVAPGDTVFIFARALKGPRMPLAVVRKTVRELPLTVTLDDSMAMTPAMRLSAFDQVRIVARISRSGTPQAQSGDLFGEHGPVKVAGAAAVQIAIDRIRP